MHHDSPDIVTVHPITTTTTTSWAQDEPPRVIPLLQDEHLNLNKIFFNQLRIKLVGINHVLFFKIIINPKYEGP